MTQQPYYPPPPPPPRNDKSTAISIGVCVLAVIGTIMSLQSTSLMNGTDSIWLGVVLVGVSVAVAFFLHGTTWVKVVASVLLGLALFSALYMEHQLSEKRSEITRDFHSWQSLKGQALRACQRETNGMSNLNATYALESEGGYTFEQANTITSSGDTIYCPWNAPQPAQT